MDKPADDRDPFLKAAASISDGAEIDWKDVGRAAVDDETTAILVQLQVVERIARLHNPPRAGSTVRIEPGSRVPVPGSWFRSGFISRVRSRKPRT